VAAEYGSFTSARPETLSSGFSARRLSQQMPGLRPLFLGAATVVLLLRRSLGTLDSAIRAEAPLVANDTTSSGYWPSKKTAASLEKKIRALSNTQWSILRGIAETEGVHSWTLAERGGMGPSMFHHRLRGLVDDELFSEDNRKALYLHSSVTKLLKRRSLQELRE